MAWNSTKSSIEEFANKCGYEISYSSPCRLYHELSPRKQPMTNDTQGELDTMENVLLAHGISPEFIAAYNQAARTTIQTVPAMNMEDVPDTNLCEALQINDSQGKPCSARDASNQSSPSSASPASTAAVAEALKCLMAARELIESIAIIQGMYAHAARQGRSYKAQALIEINDAIAALTKATPSGTAGEGV